MLPQSTVARLSAGLSLALILAILGALAWTQWLAPERAAGGRAIGGSFQLTDTQGESFTAQDLHGRYALVFFGYSHCPDVCPTTLNAMSRALDVVAEQRPAAAKRVTPVFITIDPARDDVARMRQYVANFHPRTVGLTGTPEQIARAAKAYHVSYSKVDPEDLDQTQTSASGEPGHDGADHASMDHGAYLMQHSSYVFLMGPDGGHLAHVNALVGAPRIAEMIREHVAG